MRAVLLAFTRDASVAEERRTHPRVEARSGDGRSLGSYPPCGVVPFRGMARPVAPLCYLYPHPADAYAVFRAFHTRHFWRLREIGEETFPNPTLPGLCRAFEDMIHRAEPEVCFRLLRVGCPALTLVAPWMLGGFATHLEVEQVLLLWDRVIGFDSVLPLAVAAAAVVAFRRRAPRRDHGGGGAGDDGGSLADSNRAADAGVPLPRRPKTRRRAVIDARDPRTLTPRRRDDRY